MSRRHLPPVEHHPQPFQVARWGKFWSLEPLFGDERAWLVAQGGPQPRIGDIVLAVPVHGNRQRITQVLGTGNDMGAVLKAMMYAARLPQGFSNEVEEEAATAQRLAAIRDPDRTDVCDVPTFTIDPDTARDYDDAISVRREGKGYRAWVHIADVSYYVPSDGPIDLEARERTSSVYLPLWAEPMLPHELSSGVCSLKAGEDRKCVTVEFVFDETGERRDVRLYRSLIRSDDRLTYGYVDKVLEAGGRRPAGPVQEADSHAVNASPADGAAADGDPDLVAHLLLAQELGQALRVRRFARGALQIGSFEPEYGFDSEGRLVSAAARPETASHALVEEFMLAANEAVAQFLLKKKGRVLYRVHEDPDPYAVDSLFTTLEDLGVPTPPFPAPDRATPEQVAAVLRRLSEQLPHISARENRGRLAFPQLLLRSLKQAYYSPENLGHFGLASSAYVHFTSPIRRYPDLVVHRSLLKHLGLDGAEFDEGALQAVGVACSMAERTIAKLELRADDVALAFLLEERLGRDGWETTFEGEIIGLLGSGLFVRFGGTFEGYLPVRRLGDERFSESPTGSSLEAVSGKRRFRLGDPVTVRVVRIQKVRGKVELTLAGEAGDALERDCNAAGARRPGQQQRGPKRRPGKAPGRHRGSHANPPKRAR
jgi:ribonuclease R